MINSIKGLIYDVHQRNYLWYLFFFKLVLSDETLVPLGSLLQLNWMLSDCFKHSGSSRELSIDMLGMNSVNAG